MAKSPSCLYRVLNFLLIVLLIENQYYQCYQIPDDITQNSLSHKWAETKHTPSTKILKSLSCLYRVLDSLLILLSIEN